MTAAEIAGVIGAITGSISILGLAYTFGFKFGRIDTKLKEIEDKLIDQKEFGSLTNKVDTLYQIYVLDALHKQRTGSNPKSGKSKSMENELPSELLNKIRKKTLANLDKLDYEIVSMIIEEIGSSKPRFFIDMSRQLSPTQIVVKIYEEVQKVKKSIKSRQNDVINMTNEKKE